MQRAMDRFFLRSGAYTAPRAVFRTPGAAPTFLMLLWLSENDKPYSPIAWFAVLNTSFEGPKTGVKSDQVDPEHPRISYEGAEADVWPTLGFNI